MKDWIKKNILVIGLVIINIIIITISVCRISYLKKENGINKHNYETAVSEMETLRIKNGDLVAERDSYVATVKDLERLNISSQKEIRELKKALDKDIAYISKLESQIKITPAEVHDTVYVNDGVLTSKWGAGDEWYTLTGVTTVKDSAVFTSVNRLEVDAPLTVGLTDTWSIFVTTANPYISFSDIEGAVLDKSLYTGTVTPKRWGMCVSAGFGFGYDLIGKGLYAGPGVQVGFYYRLF